MENLVPLGTGNSRLMKSNIPASTTLAQLIQMWNNGTFPYDIGPLNSAGISQQGTPLNKATLLKDATAALFGFGVDALPDDMFNALAHTGDFHVWKRTQNGQVDYPVSPNRNAYQEGSNAKPAGYTLGEVQNGQFILSKDNDPWSTITWKIGSAVGVTDDGTVSLKSIDTAFTIGGTSDYLNNSKQLIGKYAVAGKSNSVFQANTVYYFPNDATTQFEFPGASNTQKITVSKYQTVTGYAAIPATTTIEYIGQLGNKARIETGSYVGTGTYGSSNPNSLTFGFEPKLWGILGRYANNNLALTPFLVPYGNTRVYGPYQAGGTATTTIDVSYSGSSVSWYASGFSADEQFNESNSVYYYVAIG